MTIEEIYQLRRDRQAKLLELRRNAIEQEHPELAELIRQINLANVRIAKAQVFDNVDTQNSELERIELQAKKREYMRANGIDESELKLQYDCALCKDRGVIDEGEQIKNCPCMLKIQETLRKGQPHLNRRLDKENFDSFDLTIFDDKTKYDITGGIYKTELENILEIKNASLRFVHNLGNENTKSLYFYGGVGLGKSFMCSCIAKAAIERGNSVLYFTMHEFVDMMQLYSFDRSIFFERFSMEDYYALENADLLILDDLGSELTNSFVRTSFFNILNSRMINGKKMLISTNLSPDRIAEVYDERISSRVMEYMENYRFVGKNKRW